LLPAGEVKYVVGGGGDPCEDTYLVLVCGVGSGGGVRRLWLALGGRCCDVLGWEVVTQCGEVVGLLVVCLVVMGGWGWVCGVRCVGVLRCGLWGLVWCLGWAARRVFGGVVRAAARRGSGGDGKRVRGLGNRMNKPPELLVECPALREVRRWEAKEPGTRGL